MSTGPAVRGRVLSPETVALLGRLRLRLARRVDGRFVGAHRAVGHGSSQDFADYREYTMGDDPRLLDAHAYARLGRRLVKLYAAEDTAALRVILDTSTSMTHNEDKAESAQRAAAVLVAVATGGGDRARLLLAGQRVDPGPWYAGPAALPAAEARLLAAGEQAGVADLQGALRRAMAEGPHGPVALITDLFTEDWEASLRLLSSRGRDALLVHLLGREDLEPTVRGDVRLADVETGAEVEVAVAHAALDRYRATRDAWLEHVQRVCGARAIAYVRLVDDEPVTTLVNALRRVGWLS
jgi:uncharacterized protein (DUF58 family)